MPLPKPFASKKRMRKSIRHNSKMFLGQAHTGERKPTIKIKRKLYEKVVLRLTFRSYSRVASHYRTAEGRLSSYRAQYLHCCEGRNPPGKIGVTNCANFSRIHYRHGAWDAHAVPSVRTARYSKRGPIELSGA